MQRMPDLDDALQDLSESVGRRLVLLDAGMRVAGYSIHESEGDRARISHILAHSDSWPAPSTATHEHVIEHRQELGDCLFIRLTDRNRRIVGHLVAVLGDAGPPNSGDLDRLLDSARTSLGVLLTLRAFYAERDVARSRGLTHDLILGGPDQRTAAAEALLAERFLSASGRYCAVALGVDPRRQESPEADMAALAVSTTLNFVAQTSTASVVGTALPDGVGVLVFPRPVVVPRLTRILERPQVVGVRAGIGPLTDLTQVYRSFEQARLAWRASCFAPDHHPTVLEVEQAGIDAVLARLPLEKFTAADLPSAAHRVITAGFAYDMLLTLDCYLDHGGDAQRTARTLRIHRSTLYYRLDKMRDVIGGDLRDGRLRRELHTGLHIAKLSGLASW